VGNALVGNPPVGNALIGNALVGNALLGNPPVGNALVDNATALQKILPWEMLLEKDIHIPGQEVQDFCEQMEGAQKLETQSSIQSLVTSEFANFLKC